jgi:hypothetical protein
MKHSFPCLLRILFCALFAILFNPETTHAAPDRVRTFDLAGEWQFALDPDNRGLDARWFAATLPAAETIALPGTTDIAKKGPLNKERLTDRLTRRHKFVGKAWYQRDIVIPDSWKDRRVVLTLERTKATTVWLDDAPAGPQQTFLSVPHRHVLTLSATPGKHRLTILVDNDPRLFPAGGHMIDESIQTNWNGIIGKISLKETGPVWIERVRITPDIPNKTALLEVTLAKSAPGEVACHINPDVRFDGHLILGSPLSSIPNARFNTPTYVFRKKISLSRVVPWDEWKPKTPFLALSVFVQDAGEIIPSDFTHTYIPSRQFSHSGSTLLLNSKPIFLRGKHDALAFPLTGAPPIDYPSWLRYFARCKEYGINHIRYHSACPPEDAFAAADELGLYLQVENPARGGFLRGKGRLDYQLAEARAILDEYGNHPSFAIYPLGNELGDNAGQLGSVIADLRKYDGDRRLYAYGSNNGFNRPRQQPGDDLWVTMRTVANAAGNVRGSFSHADLPLGHIETAPPGTQHDFSAALKNVTLPVIGHEVGQYQTYPNFDEIPRYTGVLEARNLEIFRDRLNKAGMGDRWRDFFKASFELSLLCYKEDIEAALRTPGFGGFQLLDLQDFHDQGTALVGVLDAFMEPKTADLRERWTQFCSPTVPLALFEKYAHIEGDVFTAQIKVAHYGEKDFKGSVSVMLHGDAFFENRTEEVFIKRGTVTEAYTFYGPDGDGALVAVDGKPDRLTLTVTVSDENKKEVGRNSWVVWTYPNYIDSQLADAFKGLLITHDTATALTAVESGKKVLLLNPPAKPLPSITPAALTDAEAALAIGGVGDRLAPKEITRTERRIPGLFMTDFWNYPMFKGIAGRLRRAPSPGTLGILCDPKHPLFEEFPTEFHTNWQWWHLIKGSNSYTLDNTPSDFRPIVQVVDNFARNHKIGLIFEGRAEKGGPGKLLVCAIDEGVLRERPEGRQLLVCLAKYMNSPAFLPKLSVKELKIKD